MGLKFTSLIIIATLTLGSCNVFTESAKYKFNDGIYHTHNRAHQVYVDRISDDTIAVYPVLQFKDSTAILTNKRIYYTSEQRKLKDSLSNRTFYKPSFDIDVTTIPLKYRPSVDGYPNQLTANFNGAIYIGYRTDAYQLVYHRSPLNIYKQDVKHTAYSAGLYAGFGSTLIQGWTIDNKNNNIEYEGVTLTSGISANLAVANYTFGISLGFDHLLDKYHEYWVYQGRPYFGFMLGLNLN